MLHPPNNYKPYTTDFYPLFTKMVFLKSYQSHVIQVKEDMQIIP